MRQQIALQESKAGMTAARPAPLAQKTHSTTPVGRLLHLQQTHGNRFVQRMLSGKAGCKCGSCCGGNADTSSVGQRPRDGASAFHTQGSVSQSSNGGQRKLNERLDSATQVKTFSPNGEGGTTDPESGSTVFSSTCCPIDEGQPVSSVDKFTVFNMGALPDRGGTVAQNRLEYSGGDSTTGECACRCCAFVQFVKGYADKNGVRQRHILPGSGLPLSPTVNQQDSPILAHSGCHVPAIGGGRLNDNPGFMGIRPTDNIHVHFEFDARTIDTCNSNSIVATRLFTVDISGTHPRTFSVTGDVI
jgi:hypothetical protein